jgi:hypothetical protein
MDCPEPRSAQIKNAREWKEGKMATEPLEAQAEVRGETQAVDEAQFEVKILSKRARISKLKTLEDRLVREKLSPFVEAALGQLIQEIPHTREGYEVLRRMRDRIAQSCVKGFVQKKHPSKGRRRSEKELAKNKLWFDANRREVRDERRQAG